MDLSTGREWSSQPASASLGAHGDHGRSRRSHATTEPCAAPTLLIDWRDSPRHGRGVFAARSLDRDMLVERAPAIEADVADSIRPYLFSQKRHREERSSDSSGFVLVCGLMSLCNHSGQPNAEVMIHHEDRGLHATLSTLAPIEADEEVVIEYPDLVYYRAFGVI